MRLLKSSDTTDRQEIKAPANDAEGEGSAMCAAWHPKTEKDRPYIIEETRLNRKKVRPKYPNARPLLHWH